MLLRNIEFHQTDNGRTRLFYFVFSVEIVKYSCKFPREDIDNGTGKDERMCQETWSSREPCARAHRCRGSCGIGNCTWCCWFLLLLFLFFIIFRFTESRLRSENTHRSLATGGANGLASNTSKNSWPIPNAGKSSGIRLRLTFWICLRFRARLFLPFCSTI